VPDVVIRVRYRVPAAAPEPYNRRGAAWGVTAPRRLMRAILNAARISSFSNPVGVVEDGHRKSQRDRVLTGCGRAIRSLTTHDAQPARVFFHRLLNVCQDAKRDVSNHLKTPFVTVVNHVRTKAWRAKDGVQRNSEAGA
jgi:hypothetical protein